MNEALGNSLLQLAYRHSIQTCFPAAVGITLMGYYLSKVIEGNWWLTWTLVSVCIYAFRPIKLRLLRRSAGITTSGKLVGTGIYNLICGAIVGACVLFFPYLDLVERLTLSFIIVGFGAGGSATNAGYVPIYACFIVPLLAPLAIYWTANPQAHVAPEIAISLGASLFVLMALMIVLANDTFKTLSAFVEISEKETAMKSELSSALVTAEIEKKKAELSSSAKTRFLASASHDLRQPVHVVSLYGAVLETMTERKETKEVVSEMNAAIESLSEQLNSLLDLSTLDAGIVIPAFKQYDLRNLVNRIYEEFKTEAQAKEIRLNVNIENSVFILTDKIMFMQIMRNIVGNAIKYTDNGTVLLCIDNENEHVIVHCRDTGRGISAEDQPHIFEEFYQTDNPDRNRSKGLGLGLSIVDRLAACLSHQISLESQIGIGTHFSMKLEKTLSRIDADDGIKGISTDAKHLPGLDIWVHVVDDELTVRKSMSMFLRELGCRVTSTSSTMETISFLAENRPDMIFVDLRLHRGDSGIDTLIAVDRIDPGIRCVMITGETSDSLQNLRISSDLRILRKPVGKRDIVELLNIQREENADTE